MPSKTKVATKGVCSFCEAEIDTTKMTQHLKFCKKRVAVIAASTEDETAKKQKLFQILVEGKYGPDYWMYLEMPASEQLITLDVFLRAIWLECCGHLSAFRIDGVSYEDERSYDDFSFQILGAPDQPQEDEDIEENDEVEEEEEEEQKDLSPEELAKGVGDWFDTYKADFQIVFPAELEAELKTPRS